MGQLFSPENFIREDVLNIFTDGSYKGNKNENISAMATIAMRANKIIYSNSMLLAYGESANAAEIDAIRYAYSYAALNMNKYNMINIFSDSAYAIGCIRDYIQNWRIKYNFQKDQYHLRKNHGKGQIVEYDDLIYLIVNLIVEYEMQSKVFLFHVKSHQATSKKGTEVVKYSFSEQNNMPFWEISDDFAKYISNGNRIADNRVKKAYGYYYDKMKHGFKPAYNPLTIYPNKYSMNELINNYNNNFIQRNGKVIKFLNSSINDGIIWRQEDGEDFQGQTW